MDANQEFEKWWKEFWQKENKGMDWYTATRLAFLAGVDAQKNTQSENVIIIPPTPKQLS